MVKVCENQQMKEDGLSQHDYQQWHQQHIQLLPSLPYKRIEGGESEKYSKKPDVAINQSIYVKKNIRHDPMNVYLRCNNFLQMNEKLTSG